MARFVALLIVLWGLFAAGTASAAPQTYVLEPGEPSVSVGRGVEYLIESPGERLTPELVASAANESRWRASSTERLNLGLQIHPVWLRFALRNEAGADARWLFVIDSPPTKRIDVHQLDAGGARVTTSHSLGVARPSPAGLPRDPQSPIPLEFNGNPQTMLLVRLESDTAIGMPMTVWTPRAFHAHSHDRAVLMGLLFGILGVMLFYNLSLYVFTRDGSYGWYSCYLLAIILYELAATGVGPCYVWSGSEYLRDRGYGLFACLSFLSATVFVRHLLELQRARRHLNVMNLVLLFFFLGCTVAAVFRNSVALSMAITLGGMVSGVFALYTSIYLMCQGNVMARYFTIAWGTLIVSTAVTLLAFTGAIEGNLLVSNSQHIGFVLETVLLSIALADRIKRERAKLVVAQREALVLARKVEQEREEEIRAQEHALALQLKANEDLELRVLDRTAELKRAMGNVELANLQLAKLSVTDGLTKVSNRRFFDETLSTEINRSLRTGLPLALMLVDIDHLKKVNDSVGHLGGDECLKLVAAALTACVGRSSDLVARYGGEEFGVILPATDAQQAMEVAERIRTAVNEIQFIYRARRVPISVSVGVAAHVARAGEGASQFISEADQALYAAKGAGRNQAHLAVANA